MTIKLIIFDFDGTLADSIEWFGDAINVAAEKYNFKKTNHDEMEMLREKNTKEIISYLNISWWKIPLLSRFMRNHMQQHLHLIKLFPEIRELLIELSKNEFKLALVTSNASKNVEAILGHDLFKLFSIVECGSSVFGKPVKFKKVIRMAKLPHDQILSIGDEIRDIEAARTLGIKSAAVTWGYAKKNALDNARADYLFDSVDQIVTKLCRY